MSRCSVCETVEISQAAQAASQRLLNLPVAAQAALLRTYGLVPAALCAACFIPALAVANQGLWAVSFEVAESAPPRLEDARAGQEIRVDPVAEGVRGTAATWHVEIQGSGDQ
jgi:hypothetical protein